MPENAASRFVQLLRGYYDHVRGAKVQPCGSVIRPRFKGLWWDEHWKKDAHGVYRKVFESAPLPNAQMDVSIVLTAALFGNAAGFSGILQHAQGRGDPGWGVTPPAISTSDTTLFDELGRKTPDSILFLDPLDVVVAGPTNKFRVTTTYLEADFAGETIREQALFGGDATATIDSGYMVNGIRSQPRFKGGDFQLIRKIVLEFS